MCKVFIETYKMTPKYSNLYQKFIPKMYNFFGHEDIVWISLFTSYRGGHKTHARIDKSCLKIIELAQNVIIYSLYDFKAVLITVLLLREI